MFTIGWIGCLMLFGRMNRDVFGCGLIVAPVLDAIMFG